MKKFMMNTTFMTITQFLKTNDYITSGGEAKFFLCDHDVKINGEKVFQRGKKIHADDLIEINGFIYKVIYDQKN